MNPSTVSGPEIILIAEECIRAVYDQIIQHYGLTQEQADNREYIGKLFLEYGKGIPFLPTVLTEKGIASLWMGDAALAYRMFSDAVAIDTPDNPYWQQYFYLALMQMNSMFEAQDEAKAKETIQQLTLKYPGFKGEMKKLAERVPGIISAEGLVKLETI